MVFASLLSTLSAFPCCASITSLKPPTTRIMPPPLQCCQLACVYKIMCFLSIYVPTLSFNSLLSAAGFVVHILSSLACFSAPSRQYECHVACLYSMSIIIPTTKHNSKGEREREIDTLWFIHLIMAFLSPGPAIRATSCSLISKSDSGCSALS